MYACMRTFLEMSSNRYIISLAFLLPYKWLPILWYYYGKKVSLVHLLNLQQHYANLPECALFKGSGIHNV